MRSCVVCRETKPKRELTRLVRGEDHLLHLDPGGKMPGRGAYLCGNPKCWRGAARGTALDKALRVALGDEDRVMLEAHAAELS